MIIMSKNKLNKIVQEAIINSLDVTKKETLERETQKQYEIDKELKLTKTKNTLLQKQIDNLNIIPKKQPKNKDKITQDIVSFVADYYEANSTKNEVEDFSVTMKTKRLEHSRNFKEFSKRFKTFSGFLKYIQSITEDKLTEFSHNYISEITFFVNAKSIENLPYFKLSSKFNEYYEPIDIEIVTKAIIQEFEKYPEETL